MLMHHFITHSCICVILLSTTLSRVQIRKKFNVLILISSIYILLYLLGYGKKLFILTNNIIYIIYILIYLFIIGFYIYVIFKIFDIKKKADY